MSLKYACFDWRMPEFMSMIVKNGKSNTPIQIFSPFAEISSNNSSLNFCGRLLRRTHSRSWEKKTHTHTHIRMYSRIGIRIKEKKDLPSVFVTSRRNIARRHRSTSPLNGWHPPIRSAIHLSRRDPGFLLIFVPPPPFVHLLFYKM